VNGLFIASYVVLWLLVICCAALLLLVYRHFGLIAMSTGEGHERDGLAVGSRARDISGVDRDNSQVQWTPPVRQHTLLVFALPGCDPCEQIAPYLGALGQATRGTPFGIVVAATGRGDAVQALEVAAGPGVLCLGDDGSGAMANYDVKVTPFAFLIGPDQQILGKGNLSTTTRLRRLLQTGDLDGPVHHLERIVKDAGSGAKTLNLVAVEE